VFCLPVLSTIVNIEFPLLLPFYFLSFLSASVSAFFIFLVPIPMAIVIKTISLGTVAPDKSGQVLQAL
jgi:hypothetical protein